MNETSTRVRLVEPIRHKSVEYPAGHELALPPGEAAQLVAAGHAVPADPSRKPKEKE